MTLRDIGFTEKGVRVAIAVSLTALFALIFQDIILTFLSVVAGAALLLDIFDVHLLTCRMGEAIRFENRSFELRLIRGDSASQEMVIHTSRELELDPPGIEGLRLEPRHLAVGRNMLIIDFHGGLVGHHKASSLDCTILCRHRLLKKRGSTPFEVDVRVYPKLVVAVAEAISFLLRRGMGATGETPTPLKGQGLEYASTREYSSGDSLHRVDWKATARHSALMIKEFHSEGGASLHVAYDPAASGPVTHDELATGFVNILLSAARSGTPLSVTILNPNGRFLKIDAFRPEEALAASLVHVIDYDRIGLDDLHAILDLIPSRATREAVHLFNDDDLRALIERHHAKKWYDGARIVDRLRGLAKAGTTTFIIVTSLASNSSTLIDAIGEITPSASLSVAIPSRPWADASSLEEAYLIRRRVEKVRRAIQRLGADIISATNAKFEAIHQRPPIE